MHLNDLSAAPGRIHRRKRVGRGMGSGLGKTCGRGHKGQKSRKSGNVRPGFEGGQMPLQKRLPKYGFTSRVGRTTAKVRLGDLMKIEGDMVDLDALKAADLINDHMLRARIFLAGTIDKAMTVKGLAVTAGARAAIEAAGGKVEA
jgi:large subunit ribosomal protein L15